MKKIVIILLLLAAFKVDAQNLKANELKALVNLVVTDLSNNPLVGESVLFLSQDGEIEFSIKTDDKGEAQILLPKGKTYDVKYRDLIEKVKYSSIEVPSGLGKYSFDIKIRFEPSDVVELKGVSFNQDGSLNEKTCLELDLMSEVLVLYPKMEIVVTVHSDNSKSEKKSKEITQKQSEAVKSYLVLKSGAAEERIKPVGMGSSQPIVSNSLPNEKLRNNRIEIRVTKKYL